MAGNPTLKAKIVNVEPDPRAYGRTIVSVEFDDGNGKPWIQGYTVIPLQDQPPSLEMFVQDIVRKHHKGEITIQRPKDPMRFLKDEQQKGTQFEVNLDPPKKPEEADGNGA